MEFPLHSQQLLSALRTQRQQGFLCDCTVLVGSSRFLAHGAVLASCSPYFHMFFSDSPGGGGALSVTLDDDIVTPEAFGSVLDFIYEGVLPLEVSVPVEDVLAAASFLHMNAVVRLCRKRLQRRGPQAEADSTRSEDGVKTSGRVEMNSGVEQTPPTDPSTHVAMAADVTRVKISESPDVADTTQPCTESSPLLPIIELVHSQGAEHFLLAREGHSNVRSDLQAEVLCSPCSSTETSSSQQPSSSSLPPPGLIADPATGALMPFPASHLPHTESVHCQSPALSHPECVQVKVEAIVISDEELEEAREEGLMAEVEDSEEDLMEDETSSARYLSFQHTRALPMTSHSSFSPSSSTSGVGRPSRPDGPFPPAPLFHSRQTSDQPVYFQDLQEGGNFPEDVPTCAVCGKTFSCTYTLRRHAIVHTRQRPYECQYCFRSYTQSGDLYRHIRRVHDQTLPAKRSRTDVTPQATPQLNDQTGGS